MAADSGFGGILRGVTVGYWMGILARVFSCYHTCHKAKSYNSSE